MLKTHRINKSDVWIESSKHEALEIFKKDGYKTSYAMPSYKLNKMTQKEVSKIQNQIENISYSKKVDAISFSEKYYNFTTSLKLNQKISLLTWFRGKTFNELRKNNHFISVLKNPRIKVVLVEDELGKYHY